MKKILLFIIMFLSFIPILKAQNDKIEFGVFTRENCTHCIELKNFLEENKNNFWNVSPKFYSIDEEKNYKLFSEFTSKNNISKITPIILIWDEIIEWYQSDDTTGKYLLEKSKILTKNSYFENFSWVKNTIKTWKWCDDSWFCKIEDNSKFEVKIPFVWIINLKDYSLLFLASILWFVDGFNPCAMWVLVMFISILSQTWSRKKMFQVAWVFVLAEAIMYYMILNFWYKTWDFIALDNIVTPIIWVVSFLAWSYFIYEFFTNKDWECKVISWNQKKKTIDRIKYIASMPMTIWVFFVTILIAFSVNIVEFACSIGIPQAFTKLLDISDISFISKQIYILIYTFFYMIDDFVVFWVAIYAMSYLTTTTKYSRYCVFIWWVIMIILWYFFLFNPELLKLVVS